MICTVCDADIVIEGRVFAEHCHHKFCYKCIRQRIRENYNTCPICLSTMIGLQKLDGITGELLGRKLLVPKVKINPTDAPEPAYAIDHINFLWRNRVRRVRQRRLKQYWKRLEFPS